MSATPKHALKDIPGGDGLPFLGHALHINYRRRRFFEELRKKHGNVFRIKVFNQRTVVLVGPDAAELVFKNAGDTFSVAQGWKKFVGGVMPECITLKENKEHALHKKILIEGFNKEHLESYLSTINNLVESMLFGLNLDSDISFYLKLKMLTLEVATNVAVGFSLGTKVIPINKLMLEGIDSAFGSLVRHVIPDLMPPSVKNRRNKIFEIIDELIPYRRGAHEKRSDILSILSNATDENGEYISNEEIVNNTIQLATVGHETTTNGLAMLAFYLAKNQDWQDRLYEESKALDSYYLTFDDLSKLKAHDWAFKESLRIAPPLHSLPRYAVKPFEFEGHKVPGGTPILLSLYLTHHMAEYWPEPEKWDPLRFDETKPLSHKYAWIPFGGGAHKCIGMGLAMMEAKAIFHQLLLRYRISLPKNYKLKFRLFPNARSLDGLPLVFTRR